MARRDPVGICLLTRNGNDWSARFPLVVEAVNHVNVRSCLIDGEVVCCDEKGVAAFQLLRHHRNEPQAFLYAFDLLELNGADLRREPIEVRKATLASILRKRRPGVRLNEHLEHPDGHVVFHHACTLGAEGIVSKRLGSRYRSGRSPDWLKFKNPQAPAVRREACPSSSARPASAPGSTRTARTTPAYTGESVASTRPALRWFWWLTVNSPMTRADRVATLKEAKAQFQKSWDAWKAWAKLEEVP